MIQIVLEIINIELLLFIFNKSINVNIYNFIILIKI